MKKLIFTIIFFLLCASSLHAMQLFVKTPEEKHVTLEVEAGDLILSVKAKFEEKEGTPADQQRLFFNGLELEDDKELAYYNIPKDSTLDLVYRISESIPTLNEWGMILAGLILTLSSVVVLKKRTVSN